LIGNDVLSRELKAEIKYDSSEETRGLNSKMYKRRLTLHWQYGGAMEKQSAPTTA